MDNPNTKAHTAVRLPPKLKSDLDSIAAHEGVPTSEVIRYALKRHVDDYRDRTGTLKEATA